MTTLTATEAANILGMTRRSIINLVAQGKVRAQRGPRRAWLLNADDVASVAAGRSPDLGAVVRSWALAQPTGFMPSEAVKAHADISTSYVYRVLKAMAAEGTLKRGYGPGGVMTFRQSDIPNF